MAKRGTLDNPKTKRLARGLGTVPGVAFGLLETIWHYVGEFRKDGGLTRNDVEDALDSGGWLTMFGTDQVIAAMTDEARECILLDRLPDGRYYVHDWHDHADDAVNRSLARATRRFANGRTPDLSRLGKDERERLQAEFIRTLGAPDQAMEDQIAPEVRPECALPEPEPEPLPKPEPEPEPEPNPSRAEKARVWEEFRTIFPKRSGSSNAARAKPKLETLLRSGVPPGEILNGARRYAAFVRADGKEGTPYVRMMTTWLNAEDWKEPWTPPPAGSSRASPGGETAEERGARRMREMGL